MIRRHLRAYDGASSRERLLMLFAQSRTKVLGHLGAVRHGVVRSAVMVGHHLQMARDEARFARAVWAELQAQEVRP